MMKHLRAFRQRLRERRHYEELLSKLERLNAEDVDMNAVGAPHGVQQQVFGGDKR